MSVFKKKKKQRLVYETNESYKTKSGRGSPGDEAYHAPPPPPPVQFR